MTRPTAVLPQLNLPRVSLNLPRLSFGLRLPGATPFRLPDALTSTLKLTAEIGRIGDECRRVKGAGWLPHYTTPFEALTNASEPADIDDVLGRHYAENWASVREQFEGHIARYEIDEEAKALFREALDAHSSGYYRLVPRSLFPEIERVARIELHEGRIEKITSQKRLIELSGKLSLHDVEPSGLRGWSLFEYLRQHLYHHVTSEEQLQKVANDSVPNRHATLHGLRTYGSVANSINSLIVTDFIFQVVSALKRAGLLTSRVA